MVKGKSNHAMEDYVVSEFKQANNNKELGLFAIFDGHSGHDVANYLQRNLFENILKQVIKISFPDDFYLYFLAFDSFVYFYFPQFLCLLSLSKLFKRIVFFIAASRMTSGLKQRLLYGELIV